MVVLKLTYRHYNWGLLVGTASGTMGILAVGSDNHVLTVQSNGSLGWEGKIRDQKPHLPQPVVPIVVSRRIFLPFPAHWKNLVN
ncbi:MAG: hypothetical protein CM1200mP10_33310 [Candidatus Neomarinimicrobiota bacterium]|nr:MAG: hypothetical protein CM1200mP10_33310 [Candidatus Neomarinimicrobiota bacterium]